jgi:predicted nucleic acid-binding protein
MLVFDASVVVKVLTEEAGSDRATGRLALEPERTAPDWLCAEIASALSKKVRYAGLPIAQAEQALAALPSIMPDLVPTARLIEPALSLSIELSHAVYDCLYLALALAQDCNVVTADRKFFEAASRSKYVARVELLA